MKTCLAALGGAMLLAGCNNSAPPAAQNTTAPIAPENNIAMKVANMGDNERNVVLIRAIRDAKLACEGVSESERMGDPADMTWRAKCTNGAYYLVRITPDGTAHVTNRTN